MGLGDFLKNLFGKKNCVLCGNECGVMSRTKIRNKDYLCDDCGNQCSGYIRLSEYTLDEVKGHIEYMKRQERLYSEVFEPCGDKRSYPTFNEKQKIVFCDELGMFMIVDKFTTRRGSNLHDLFRYDMVESYEPYVEETKPSEQGGKPEFKECGVKIKLISNSAAKTNLKFGTRPHPYVKREIKVCFSQKEKTHDIINACNHFDFIFGVHSGDRGLFQFGLTTEEKRNVKAVKGAFDMFVGAVESVKEGQVSDKNMAKIEEGANAIQDASTGGLALYSRRADEAEAKIS